MSRNSEHNHLYLVAEKFRDLCLISNRSSLMARGNVLDTGKPRRIKETDSDQFHRGK